MKNIIFKEKKDIYKEKSGTVTKVKKEKLRSIISFILELCYQHRTVTAQITQNTDFFQKTRFKKTTEKGLKKATKKNLRVAIKF